MPNPLSGPSLITYLQSQSKDALRIALISTQTERTDGSLGEDVKAACDSNGCLAAPFLSIDTCSPFATILPARLALGGGDPLMDIFILVQSDRYPPAPSELAPVYNPDIDLRWQQAMSGNREKATNAFPMSLVSQKDAQGHWVPFKPLFYCSKTDQYCHPLCPDCGRELALCRDDATLEAAGLPSYRQSLARFLFCPSCTDGSASSVFYSRFVPPETVTTIPGGQLRDCRGLLKDFSRLTSVDNVAERFPCVDCANHAECYGPSFLVVSRMAPVSFYPFFALISPAPTFNLIEFVEMLSGASVEEIAAEARLAQRLHRLAFINKCHADVVQEPGLFFYGDQRRFLEVLYLKLTLIQDMIALGSRHPAVLDIPMDRMSLESFWVTVSGVSRRLPFLWEFDLNVIDIFAESPTAERDEYQGRRFLGKAWLYILLVNDRQDFKPINASMADLIQWAEGQDSDHPMPAGLSEILAPENLFWKTESVQLDPPWESFWRQSLSLGIKLLSSGAKADADGSQKTLVDRMSALRNQIRQTLFQAGKQTAAPPMAKGPSRQDRNIAAIIDDLVKKWPQKEAEDISPGEQNASSPVVPERCNEDGDVEETVILASVHRTRDVITRKTIDPALERTLPPNEKVPAGKDASPAAKADTDEKTVVLHAPPTSAEDELEKTVVMAPSPRPQTTASPSETDNLEKTVMITDPTCGATPEELDKTVVIGVPAHISGEGKGLDQTTPGPVHDRADDLDKTVVITRPDAPPSTADSKLPSCTPDESADGEEDDLDPTVIIDPDRIKTGKPEP